MLYKSKTTKYVGKHIHNPNLTLAQESDLIMQKIMNSSGFFRGQGINTGYDTTNPSMENFIQKWNAMNTLQRKGHLPYVYSNKKEYFRGL